MKHGSVEHGIKQPIFNLCSRYSKNQPKIPPVIFRASSLNPWPQRQSQTHPVPSTIPLKLISSRLLQSESSHLNLCFILQGRRRRRRMALEAVVFPHYSFNYSCKEPSVLTGREEDRWSFGLDFSRQEKSNAAEPPASETGGSILKKKRRRSKCSKNKETTENQRISHIAVERNRRRQMNDYLVVLRSLMPASYVHKIDQASIIGGAISYVKELEHLLQNLEAQKQMTHPFPFPFSSDSNSAAEEPAANVDVTMVESHVSLKVLSRQRPKQLLSMIVGLQNLRLTILHLNLSTMDGMVLYSFSLKVEDDCRLISVDELAKAVYQMVLPVNCC